MQLDRLPGKLTLLTLLAVLAFGSPASAQEALVGRNVRTPAAGDECDKLVADGVAAARSGAKAAADRSLTAATMRCPNNAAAWRELASLRFGDSQWSDASSFARKAVGLAPQDDHAWRILAASLFMEGDTQGALRAWNRVNDPRVDMVVVSGPHRTRDRVVTARVGLEPGQLLTPEAFARAVRRAEDLPVVTHAFVRYHPHEADDATVEVEIKERKRFPVDWGSVGNIAGRALVLHEVRVPFGGPTGSGERFDFEYGWKRNRPRTAVRLTVPAPGFLPGLVVLEVTQTRHTFLIPGDTGDDTLRLRRRDARLGFEDWATDRLHWHVDGISTQLPGRRFLGLSSAIDTRWLGDHVSMEMEGAVWHGTGETPGFQTAELKGHWRQKVTRVPMGWRADAGATSATDDAPLVFWAGADVGSNQEAFLRAHKFMTDGIVTSRIFGRQLLFSSVSYERSVFTHEKVGTVGLVGFVDSAKAWNGLTWERADAQVDIGFGARLHAQSFGSVRVDVGYGLRDGGVVLSAGFVRPWPRR